MFELNTYTAEDYIIWTIMEEPETYAKKALLLSPELFTIHKQLFTTLMETFRRYGAEKVKEVAGEILAKDSNAFAQIHAVRQEFILPTESDFHTAVFLRRRYIKEILINEYVKKFNNGELNPSELADKIKELDRSLMGQMRLSLKERKEELLSTDDLQPIMLPFFNLEAYPSDVVLISAKTKAGKTTVAMNILMAFLQELAEKQEEFMDKDGNWHKSKVIYFTYEITDKIMLAMFTGLYKGKNWKEVTKQEKEEFIDIYGDYMDIEYGLTLDKLIDVVWIAHPKIFVVDYDQLVLTEGRFESEERRIAHIVRSLKDVTTQTGSICILLSQINDDGKVRYSREKEHASSIHIHLEKTENEDIRYEIKLNRWGRAGDQSELMVDWITRRITR